MLELWLDISLYKAQDVPPLEGDNNWSNVLVNHTQGYRELARHHQVTVLDPSATSVGVTPVGAAVTGESMIARLLDGKNRKEIIGEKYSISDAEGQRNTLLRIGKVDWLLLTMPNPSVSLVPLENIIAGCHQTKTRIAFEVKDPVQAMQAAFALQIGVDALVTKCTAEGAVNQDLLASMLEAQRRRKEEKGKSLGGGIVGSAWGGGVLDSSLESGESTTTAGQDEFDPRKHLDELAEAAASSHKSRSKNPPLQQMNNNSSSSNNNNNNNHNNTTTTPERSSGNNSNNNNNSSKSSSSGSKKVSRPKFPTEDGRVSTKQASSSSPGGGSFSGALLSTLKTFQPPKNVEMISSKVSTVVNVSLGDRIIIDLTTLLKKGEGILLGTTPDVMLLVLGDTEPSNSGNTPPRPFRVNAGAVHGYTLLANGTPIFVSELKPGDSILVCDKSGPVRSTMVGRIIIETKPLVILYFSTEHGDSQIFLEENESARLMNSSNSGASLNIFEITESLGIVSARVSLSNLEDQNQDSS